MKRKPKRRSWWWLAILLLAIAAVLVGYYVGMERGLEKAGAPETRQKTPVTEKHVAKKLPAVSEQSESEGKPEVVTVKIEGAEKKPAEKEDSCALIEKDIQAFFMYLNKKKYIQHIQEGMNTYDRFKELVDKLSARPPIPAGEGIDANIMTKNIYLFFRILNKEDIRLIRAVLENEAETLEMNMELFYNWISLGRKCPDPDGVRPSLDTQYKYAGFFLNTIGGRAYLFRRPAAIRLLVSYYCLLVLHEADKEGMNSYGIDVVPHIESLKQGFKHYPGFHFQQEYLQRLNDIHTYYKSRR